MSKFQFVLLAVFGFFIIAAVLVFSIYRGSSSSQTAITMWGVLPSAQMNSLLSNAPVFTQDKTLIIRYVEKKASTIEDDFTEALAQGNGPDVVILSQDALWQARQKLIQIPYSNISEADFKETFAEGSEVFLAPEGIYALPVLVDPMVLYYNRDLLSSAGVAKPLGYWDEIYAATTNLTRRDGAGNIVQSTISLGETKNIANAKDILALLLLQAGTPITELVGTSLRSAITQSTAGAPVLPAVSALDFYTQFANPSKSFYSWNRSLPDAQSAFAAGESAYYLGFASELPIIRGKSPTLNFGIASVPQSRIVGKNVTYGAFYAATISRGTKNTTAALSAVVKLASKDVGEVLSAELALPPVRRDLLSLKQSDATGPVFYTAALQAQAWVDPDARGTEASFLNAINAVVSGRSRASEAVNTLNSEIEDLIKN